MNDYHSAQALLDAVETAIAQEDLVGAASAVEALKPLLMSREANELRSLKERLDALTLDVKRVRQNKKLALTKLKNKTQAIDQYQQIAAQG